MWTEENQKENDMTKPPGLEHLDTILISDLSLRCIIGINDDERKNKQDVLINIQLYADTRRAAETDTIADTPNYRTITKKVITMVESSSYQLVEAMAEEIGRIALETDGVEGCSVRVEKPGALRFAKSVGIEITRLKNA